MCVCGGAAGEEAAAEEEGVSLTATVEVPKTVGGKERLLLSYCFCFMGLYGCEISIQTEQLCNKVQFNS